METVRSTSCRPRGRLGHTGPVTWASSFVHLSPQELGAGLDHIRRSPVDEGTLELIVARPEVDQRQVLYHGHLDLAVGLVGDNWRARGNSSTPDGSADPEAQLTVMNSRLATLVAGTPDHGGLAGDQLYIDFDLSSKHLPAGSLLQIGDAVIEITAKPHRGCAKFAARFGNDALRFVNTGPGLVLNLRGRNARVIIPGAIRQGHAVRRAHPSV